MIPNIPNILKTSYLQIVSSPGQARSNRHYKQDWEGILRPQLSRAQTLDPGIS